MGSVVLKLDWCDAEAARYAVMRWHYSKRMPVFKVSRIGVWENGRFCGCVIYGIGGGNATNGKRYGLAKSWEVAELTRVALGTHSTPTSKVVAISIKMIKKANPGLRMLISFADTAKGHVGTIYQASGWVYAGSDSYFDCVVINGERVHPRTASTLYGAFGGRSYVRRVIDPNMKSIKTPPKHRYLFPLDPEMKERIEKFRKPYPKRVKEQEPAFPVGLGGATPTHTLQSSGGADAA